MRTRREKRDGKKKKFKLKVETREKSGRSVGGPGAAIRISRYEVRGTRVLAEATPANEVARTAQRACTGTLVATLQAARH